MVDDKEHSTLFGAVIRSLLSEGLGFRFRARGRSMQPAIQDGEILHVRPVSLKTLRKGDIVLFADRLNYRAHRLLWIDWKQGTFIARGDAGTMTDSVVDTGEIVGQVVAKEENSRGQIRVVPLNGGLVRWRFLASRLRARTARFLRGLPVLRSVRVRGTIRKSGFRASSSWALLICLFLCSSMLFGQVAVDSATSVGQRVTSGAPTVTLTHTTAGTNRLLLVGVSINLTPSTGTATVASVTYNGIPLIQAVAHNNAGNTRRAEMWYLVAPPTGTGVPIDVTFAGLAAGNQGVVVGATTFTGADQILPIRASASAEGTASPSSVSVTSAAGDMVVDTLAMGRNFNAAVGAGQTSRWNLQSGGTTASDIKGVGSTATGAAPTVTMSETLTGATSWSEVALSIRFAVPANPVVIDTTTTGGGDVTGATPNVTFSHTTAGTNTLLVVGVDMNITGNTGANVTGVTYNGVALTRAGFRNDAGLTRRVEMWYLTAPAAGAHSVIVTLSLPGGTGTVGVVAGATTFSGVDQTVPVRSFISNDGPAVACSTGVFCSQLDVASGLGEMVIDTLAIAGNVTATVTNSQVQQWARTSVAANANPDVYGLGSTRTGAASVPISETFSAASTWSMGALSVRPYQADLSVAVSGTSALNPAPLTYAVIVTNTGTSSATGVVLNDTLAAGLTFGSATPSQGTCSGTAPISCSLGTLASGASATVTVVGTPTASGGYPNTASVTSGVPDYQLGNNSATGLAFSQVSACTLTPSRPAGGTLTGVVNTYFPVTTNLASGATSITLGAASATGAQIGIAANDLLLVIQMQDAAISSANDSTYGDGVSGAGSTSLNNAGVYEYVTATNAVGVGGGTVNISGAGPGGGLIYSYTNAAATATQGQRRFQVLRVPAYSTATLGAALTAAPWNGTTGGILALDASGTLTLNSATVSVDGLGFRGGAGLQLQGDTSATNADYLFPAPTGYAGSAEAGADASKGEGIVGTPRFVALTATPFFFNTGVEGYPNGSMAKGAPGNAGGGGTDGDPQLASPAGNDQNSGGGGGANGGNGGSGGDSWNSNLSNGGLGGAAFPATVGRVALGGGGGAGTRNNSTDPASAGAAGGGIVIIRAGALSGIATISANGSDATNVTANDSGGGGGAGGSIVVLSATGGEAGLTLSAHGGRGGDAWDIQPFSLANRHGPGGGGGGGLVLLTGAAASVSVSGGVNGTTLTPGVSYGATPGAVGLTRTDAVFNQQPGTQPGAECVPDLTITKTNAPSSFVRGQTGTYTLTVNNISTGPTASTAGIVTVVDTLPAGLAAATISGTGWGCVLGTLTCTRATVLSPGASYPPITLTVIVLQTAANPVTNTARVSGGGEVVTTNDTATDVTPVVSSADLAITKTASPTQVRQGSTDTYTLTARNNGPSNATNVVVTDTLPTAYVSYVSATPSQGSCSQAGGVVTCNLGALNGGAAATIAIVVTAVTRTGASTAVNTASVTATEPDPNSANNTATAAITIISPTQVSLESFTATQTGDGVLVSWKAGRETRNLGFNVYREENGARVRVNPGLIAGSALTFRHSLPQHAAKTYAWIDHSPVASNSYWLEDVDLNGSRTFHGPILPQRALAPAAPQAMMIQELNSVGSSQESEVSSSHIVEARAVSRFSSDQRQVQFELAGHPAVKIFVQHEGWYRITQPQLVAAGLSASVDPTLLRLFAEGTEQPISISGVAEGVGGFGPQAAIEFYGTGIDTPYSDRRVYWLVAGDQPGKRIPRESANGDGGWQPSSFPETVELKPRTTYFAALLREDTDNFFGALVSSTPVNQILRTPGIASTSIAEAALQVVLQGVTEGMPHNVSVTINGANLGALNFTGQSLGTVKLRIPRGILQQGVNTVTLTAQGGASDLSLVDRINLTYPRTYTAQSDLLKFTAEAGEQVVVHGFDQPPSRLIDITDSARAQELEPEVDAENGGYKLRVKIPQSVPGKHILLALSDKRIAKPWQVTRNHPSSWHSAQPGGEVVMMAHPKFLGALGPLVRLRRDQGKSVALVQVDQLYDEFNFGERSPTVIRDLLETATKRWQYKPKYLLLVGDASVDPRNYLGFGFFDFIPTKIIVTSELKTASDDWFSDFDNQGLPHVATGRLPVRTSDEANTVVRKTVSYETDRDRGDWTDQSLLVADRNDATDFSQDSRSVEALLPKSMIITDVFASDMDANAARQEILDGINSGKLLVNYIGHGSVEIWSGDDLLDDTAASALSNGTHLPLFLAMNCLNGFFHDVYTQSLAEALLLAKNGGAVAVWASSGLTQPEPQVQMDQNVVRLLFSKPFLTLGEAVRKAKSTDIDPDVRRTYILFGDPMLRLPTSSKRP